MHILDLQLVTPALALQHDFYATVLGFPTRSATPESVTFQAGASCLTFTQAANLAQGSYHFAFNIPENQMDVAKHWLSQRVPLQSDSTGIDTFHGENWNAHSVYFYDPAGNVVEFIARHDLANASVRSFDGTGVVNISEIGIATDDVPGQVRAIQARVAAPIYKGSVSDTFSAIGDAYGLLIVVQSGRVWFPETGRPAEQLPVTLMVADDGNHPPVSLRFGE